MWSRIQGSESGLRVLEHLHRHLEKRFGFRVSCFEFRISGLGFRVSDSGTDLRRLCRDQKMFIREGLDLDFRFFTWTSYTSCKIKFGCFIGLPT